MGVALRRKLVEAEQDDGLPVVPEFVDVPNDSSLVYTVTSQRSVETRTKGS